VKRVLVVSPHFPPVSAADVHRVRTLLPFLEEKGWEAEVLAVSPEQVRATVDPWLSEGLPAGVKVHRVRAMSTAWSLIPGLGGLGFRALRALRKAGDRLLAGGGFDLVYFSTTVFEVHILGPRWRAKFGVPFAMDYQDPWVNDYYREHPDVKPPGGRLKFFIIDRIHRRMEPRVLRSCAGITSVSAEYPRQLERRYPSIRIRSLVQPFPGAGSDFERLPPPSTNSRPDVRWTYIGRGGADMAFALRGLFIALRDHAPDELKRRLTIEFIGTSYAPSGTGARSVEPVAAQAGVGEMVEEKPDRIPYVETLSRLRAADALIVPGSDDPSYTASKIFPYLLAKRPLLAIFHGGSAVVDVMRKVGGGVCVTFSSDETAESLASRIAEKWLTRSQYRQVVPLDEQAFQPYSDRGSAAAVCRFFEECLTADLSGVRVLAALNGLELFGHERGNIEVFKTLRDRGAKLLIGVNAKNDGGVVAAELKRLRFDTFRLPFNPQWSLQFLRRHPQMLISNPWAVVRCSLRFWGAIRSFKPTHVHLGSSLAYSYVSLALAASRLPLIYRLGDCPPVDSKFNLTIWKWTMRRSNAIVGNSRFVTEQAMAAGAASEKLRVVYSLAPTRSGSTPAGDQTLDSNRLVYVGAIAEHKGLLPLMEALAALATERPGIHLDICGASMWDSTFRERLVNRIAQLRIENRVHFHGQVDDPSVHYRRAAVHVAPSICEEAAANVVFEAKREGVPSVVFPSGGLVEVVRHGIDGYICRSKSSEALIEALRWMFGDDQRLLAMRAAAREDHLARFGPERFARQWASVYRSADHRRRQ
jgi:glycosyltransferase involved in cell wall biosynthesis